MRKTIFLAMLIVTAVFIVGCNNQQDAHNKAIRKAQGRTDYFIPKNDLDFHNYNKRQEFADDPTAIIWCTSAFSNPSSPMFTMPVVGKLTSGGKRPFESDPGPDGMYGPSGEYRYGFTTSDMYADWYNMETFCTSEPTIWQREKTTMVLANDPLLLAAHNKAREALKRGDMNEASRFLEEAIKSIGRQ